MAEELCPVCLELTEDWGVSLDGTPLRESHPTPRVRTCLGCLPYIAHADIEDRPPPAGFYADLHSLRRENPYD